MYRETKWLAGLSLSKRAREVEANKKLAQGIRQLGKSMMFTWLSGDSSTLIPLCLIPFHLTKCEKALFGLTLVAYPILLLSVNRLPSKIKAGFPLVVHVVIDSMVDCNEMSIAANPPFLYYLDLSKPVN